MLTKCQSSDYFIFTGIVLKQNGYLKYENLIFKRFYFMTDKFIIDCLSFIIYERDLTANQ